MRKKYKDFIIEIKSLLNSLGKTNIITRRQLDELFVKHEINLKDTKNIQAIFGVYRFFRSSEKRIKNEFARFGLPYPPVIAPPPSIPETA